MVKRTNSASVPSLLRHAPLRKCHPFYPATPEPFMQVLILIFNLYFYSLSKNLNSERHVHQDNAQTIPIEISRRLRAVNFTSHSTYRQTHTEREKLLSFLYRYGNCASVFVYGFLIINSVIVLKKLVFFIFCNVLMKFQIPD